jgi:hypothetical protein
MDSSDIHSIFQVLGDIIRQPPSGSTDSQRLALVVIRTTSRKEYEVTPLEIVLMFQLIEAHVPSLLVPVLTCARDSNVLPLKVAAERAFMGMFRMESNGTALLEVDLPAISLINRMSLKMWMRR